MSAKSNDYLKIVLSTLIGILAVFALKSFFDSDDSKIISKKGKRLLSDTDRMKDVNRKIHDVDNSENESGVYI